MAIVPLGAGRVSGGLSNQVATVSVTPSSFSLAPLDAQQLTAVVRDSDGVILTGHVVTWSSTSPSIITVDAIGPAVQAIGVAEGVANIVAMCEGKTGSTIATVLVAVATVTVTPTTASISSISSVQLTAVAKDALGNVLPGRIFTWTSSDNLQATVTQTGLVEGVGLSGGPNWPHEPGAFIDVLDYDFGDSPALADDTPLGSSGWYCHNAGGKLSRISDPTGVVSPPYALQLLYSIGMIAGVSPGNIWKPTTGVNDHFAGIIFKYSNPFGLHTIQNKIWYPHGPTQHYIVACDPDGAGNGKIRIQVVASPDSYNLASNINNPTVTPGVQHKLEVEFHRSSTPTTADMTIKWWLDGVLCGNYGTADWPAIKVAAPSSDPGKWPAENFSEWQLYCSWGGNDGAVRTFDGTLQFDHIHLSKP